MEKGTKTPLLKREQLKKNKKAWNLIVEGTLLGKIGTFMDEMGTKVLCYEWLKRNKTALNKTITSSICNICKIGTLMVEKGTKSLNNDWKGTKSL